MNYLAHARHVLDDPWELAGTALPDWISVADRAAAIRRPEDLPEADALAPPSPELEVRRGVLRHLRDDGWFHEAPLFDELSAVATDQLRQLPSPPSRPSFFAHVLVELLVDAGIEQIRPGSVDRYYRVVDGIDAELLATTAVSLRPSLSRERFAGLFEKFRELRFVADYGEDARLAARLAGVGQRAGQPPFDRDGVASVAATVRPRAVELAEFVLSSH